MRMTPRNFYTKFLTVKSTKSLINLVDYITDKHDEHINHLSDNHKTIVFDEQQVIDRKLKNMINIFNYHNTKVKLNRKGGRPGSPASSIMISIPENIANKTVDIKTMEKFHKKMVDDTVSKLNEIYNLNWTKEEEELFKNNYLISSIHFKKSNPHINIMIPSIVQTYKNIEKDNKVMRAKSAILKIRLGLRKLSYQIKQLANRNMLSLGYSLADYEIQKQRETKRLNPIASLKQDIKEEKQKQEHISKEMQEHLLEHQKMQQQLDKFFKNIEIYKKRINDAIESNNVEKMVKYEKLQDKAQSKFNTLKSALEQLSYNNPKPDLKPQ